MSGKSVHCQVLLGFATSTAGSKVQAGTNREVIEHLTTISWTTTMKTATSGMNPGPFWACGQLCFSHWQGNLGLPEELTLIMWSLCHTGWSFTSVIASEGLTRQQLLRILNTKLTHCQESCRAFGAGGQGQRRPLATLLS